MFGKSICRACRAKTVQGLSSQNPTLLDRGTFHLFDVKNPGATPLSRNQAFSSWTAPFPSSTVKTTAFYQSRPRSIHPTSIWSNAGTLKHSPTTFLQRRHQSTSPAFSSTTSPTASLSPADLTPSSTELFSDVADQASLSATGSNYGQWNVGYLKELGLDFGWGPTSMVQWLFEHLHLYATEGIGATIVLTALTIRVCTLPTVWAAADTSSRLGALVSVTKPLQDRMKQAVADKDSMAVQVARQEYLQVRKDAGIKLWKSFLPMIQIPLGFGSWRLLRNMADVPIPGMETGGFWWFPNLVVHDPYFILPVATGLVQHLAMRMGSETGDMSESSRKMRMIFVYAMPLAAPIFIGFAPAAVQLSFITTATLTFCTTYALRRAAVRQFLNLPPIVRRSTTTPTPYRGNMTVSTRLPNHPVNVKAATQARAAVTPTVSDRLNVLRPSSVRRGFSNLGKTVTDFVGETMPSAARRAKSNVEKKKQSSADDYENKRKAELEKQKIKADRKFRRNH